MASHWRPSQLTCSTTGACAGRAHRCTGWAVGCGGGHCIAAQQGTADSSGSLWQPSMQKRRRSPAANGCAREQAGAWPLGGALLGRFGSATLCDACLLPCRASRWSTRQCPLRAARPSSHGRWLCDPLSFACRRFAAVVERMDGELMSAGPVQYCREHLGLHPCDRRRPLAYLKAQYPAVDFSLVSPWSWACRLPLHDVPS